MKLNNIYSFNPRQNITSGLIQTVILPLLLAMPILEIKQIASAQSLPPVLTPTTPLAIEKVEAGLRLVQLGDLKGAHRSADRYASASFRGAAELDPKLLAARYNLGLALRQQGQLQAAANAFYQATQLDPDFALAYGNLGAVLYVRE